MVDATFDGVPQRERVAEVSHETPPGPSHHKLRYRGAAGPVFRIAIVNSLLSLLTLGLYRFWARTRLRRYFWSHVELDGDPIEYTGTGMQLFLGFLIVLAIMVPLLFGLQFAPSFFPESPGVQVALVFGQAIVLLFLFHVAIFRARRFRLRHTRWRGIRAGQTGSSMSYALRAFGLSLLTFFTLYLAYPVYRTKTHRYLMQNTVFGDQSFTFEGRSRALFGKWILALVLSIVAAVVVSFLVGFVDGFTRSLQGGGAGLNAGPGVTGQAIMSIVGPLLIAAAVALVQVWYRVWEFRYFTSVTRFGPVRFSSDLKARNIAGIFLVYFFVLAVIFGLISVVLTSMFADAAPFLFGGVPQESLEEFLRNLPIGLIVSALVAFLFATAVLSSLQPVLIGHPIAREVAGSLKLKGRYDMDKLLQGAKTSDRAGEGLADALDVDVAGF